MPYIGRRLLKSCIASCKPHSSTTLITCKTGKIRNSGKEIHPKKAVIENLLKNALENSSFFVVFQYADLNSNEWNNFRFALGQHNIQVKVFPNKQSCKVLHGTKFEVFGHLFKSSAVTCFSHNNDLKQLLQEVKLFPKMTLLGGLVGNEFMSKSQIIEHSNLPSLEILRTELLGNISQPLDEVANTLEQVQRYLLQCLRQHALCA